MAAPKPIVHASSAHYALLWKTQFVAFCRAITGIMPVEGGRALWLKLLEFPTERDQRIMQPEGLSSKGGVNGCPLTREAFQVTRRLMVSGQWARTFGSM